MPDYDELVLVANSDKLDDQRDDLRLFISAVARGASEARKDPRGATRRADRREPRPEGEGDRASVRVTIPTLFPAGTRPWGYLDPVAWRNYGGWMVSNGLLKDLPDINAAVTNDLLPGQGLK